MHDHRIAVEIRLLRMVGEHHDALQTRDERNSRFDLMLDGTIFGVRIVCIERDDRTRQHDHQVRCRVAHDARSREAIGQFALCIDSSHELVELVLRRKLAEHEQVRDLFETITLAGRSIAEQIVDIVATERELAFDGNLVALVHHVAITISS